MRVIDETRPDVVLLDVRLPDEMGVATLRRIRGSHPEIPVLILTSHADPVLAQTADSAGAAGFLLKRIDSGQLSDAVRRVAAGERVYDEELSGRAVARDRPRDPRLARLSPREHEVLELVAEGLTNREIAGRLSVSQKTAKNYVSSMLKKLDVNTRSAAAALMARIQTERSFHYPPEAWR
jgi:DNA-binding NarL/FixJ family response regulator